MVEFPDGKRASKGDLPMGQIFKPCERDQLFLLPPNMREWLPEGHLAYFIVDLVEQMDLSEILQHYEKNEDGTFKAPTGQPPYDPRMMTGLVLYGYAVGVVGSRKIETACEEDLAFRIIAGNQRPDHDTIAEFRRVHLKALENLFVQVLMICAEAGLVKLGHVAIDGTKVKANASKHKAMSYERMTEKEAELRQEVAVLLAKGQAVDVEEDQRYGKHRRGDEWPAELARKEDRLKKIREAKKVVEERAKAKAIAEGRLTADGKAVEKPGKKPTDPPGTPEGKDQYNFTDPESRIMKNSDKAFVQAYNCQAGADAEHQIIVARDVTPQTNDKEQALPITAQVKANTGQTPGQASYDAGYFSDTQVTGVERTGVDVYCSPDRLKHGENLPKARGRMPKGITTIDRMRRKVRTERGRDTYSLRKETIEPVFGQIKNKGLRQFLLRGLEKVKGEWSLWCTGHNLTKLWRIKGKVCPHWVKSPTWGMGMA
jgi:transposase